MSSVSQSAPIARQQRPLAREPAVLLNATLFAAQATAADTDEARVAHAAASIPGRRGIRG
jgi:hypothetical protein